jgi:dihydrofolate reductase
LPADPRGIIGRASRDNVLLRVTPRERSQPGDTGGAVSDARSRPQRRPRRTTVLSDDLAAAIVELKAKPDGELQVHGSGARIRWLIDHDLVDEINLFTYPVVVGQGTRLFPDTGPDRALELIESQTTPGGVTIQGYRPAGRPEYAT